MLISDKGPLKHFSKIVKALFANPVIAIEGTISILKAFAVHSKLCHAKLTMLMVTFAVNTKSGPP